MNKNIQMLQLHFGSKSQHTTSTIVTGPATEEFSTRIHTGLKITWHFLKP
jgi:hypothetical protein